MRARAERRYVQRKRTEHSSLATSKSSAIVPASYLLSRSRRDNDEDIEYLPMFIAGGMVYCMRRVYRKRGSAGR